MQSFDALDARTQTLALKAMSGFRDTPRAPSALSHIVSHPDPRMTLYDVWDVPIGNGYHLTYCVIADDDPDHFVCVLRNIGRAD
jgi:hypothetical protein